MPRAKPAKIMAPSRLARPLRRKQFLELYMSNGQDGTAAAEAVGYAKGRSARNIAQRFLGELTASGELAAAAKDRASAAELSTEAALRVANCLLQSDPRKLFHPDGKVRKVTELDDETAQAVKVEIVDGVVKMGFWPKPEALTNVMKHLGLFEKDNNQRGANLAIQVLLVGSKDDVPAIEGEVVR